MHGPMAAGASTSVGRDVVGVVYQARGERTTLGNGEGDMAVGIWELW